VTVYKKFNVRFWWRHGMLPFGIFAVLAWLFAVTDWDLRLSDPFYDPLSGGWPYKRSWWAGGLIHTGGKYLILLIGISALLAYAASFARRAWRRWRNPALFLCLCIGLSTGLVALGKQLSNRHCPWDYDRYGGSVPYAGLFAEPPAECGPGRCFPAGHASGGFSLMGLYFVARRKARALAGLGAGVLLGAVFGFGQVARGAHFASHNLWTAAICWTVSLGLYVWFFPDKVGPGSSLEKSP